MSITLINHIKSILTTNCNFFAEFKFDTYNAITNEYDLCLYFENTFKTFSLQQVLEAIKITMIQKCRPYNIIKNYDNGNRNEYMLVLTIHITRF
jgi:hypothetical protein